MQALTEFIEGSVALKIVDGSLIEVLGEVV